MQGTDTSSMSFDELMELCSEDFMFYAAHYFPKAIRQDSPEFHFEIAEVLDSNLYEKIAAKVFRGGAKTTLARVLISKRIAFGISRTILVVSETAEHSYSTVKWIKRAIEKQTQWARDFGLVQGNLYEDPETKLKYTWRDDMIQIVCKHFEDVEGKPVVITMVGTGIFGQSRGLNLEDYRPDFILLDDVIDEDNAKTEEQRTKVNERIYGAIVNTLAPRSEAPTATILMLQTPLNQFDAIELASKDPEWKYLSYSCFDEHGQSRWPARWTTQELLLKKAGFIKRNQLSLWMKEMEVKITSSEQAMFIGDWFLDNVWKDASDLPDDMVVYMGIDPTPPPKPNDQKSSDALTKLDDTVFMVIGCRKTHVYELDVFAVKSPLPIAFYTKFFELAMKWRPRRIGFESVLFARTYAHGLNDEMLKRRMYFNLYCVEDRRSKSVRIRESISDLAFSGHLHLKESDQTTMAQALQYPDVDHDDHLDALSIALMCRNPGDIIEGEYDDVTDKYQEDYTDDWRSSNLLGHRNE